MKKALLSFFLIIVLSAAASAQRGEIWTTITSVSTIAGKWAGSEIMEIPRNETTGIPNSILKFSIFMEYVPNSKDVTIEMQIDFNQFLDDWIKVPAMRELKVTKDQIWNMVKELLKNILEENITFDNNYRMSYFMNSEADSFSGSNNLQINQDRTMIKLIFDETISFGLGDKGITEMILTKNWQSL